MRDDGHDGEEDADEAVLKYGDPDHLESMLALCASSETECAYIEPGQTTSGSSQPALLSTSCDLLEVPHRPDPSLGSDCTEVDLLLVQIRCQICAHQAEERGDRECLVTVPNDLKVDAVLVVVDREEGDGGVDRDHEEDANDVFLFPWF